MVEIKEWVEVRVKVPVELSEAVTNFLTEAGSDGVCEEVMEADALEEGSAESPSTVLKAYFPQDGRLARRLASLEGYLKSVSSLFPHLPPASYETEVVTDVDWSESWKKYFKPIRVTRNIVIKPTWERYSVMGHDIVIEMDPGMAFGTGQHASTRMCLQALEDLLLYERATEGARVLDVGTGTGILGIAAAKLGAKGVTCVDIDRQAIEIARENIKINGVADLVKAEYRDVRTLGGEYDLIVANLTDRVLVRLRPHLISLLEPGGFLIISGIIEQNRPEVEAHYLAPPLVLYRSLTEKEWISYVFQKESSSL
ncbi:MAG TPA: 50S ribosomal protein L11 methyltransferase [Syntrophales bacterium]|nr:50S ribosomal protein L11 methyltransferase [Syntrophales bacterium]HOL59428.1 50S ribosomal protein L11 methyltransferase [Syntrophales bacterium]HPO35585.1 50S ribosomal protein L11 methyltransferase [Syntrophales bacterium]